MDDQNQTGQEPVAVAPVVDGAGAGSLQKPSPAAVAELGVGAAEARGVADAREAGAEAEASGASEDRADVQAAEKAAAERRERDAHFDQLHERARALVAAYEHGMETNSPRTMAELNELKDLLFGE